MQILWRVERCTENHLRCLADLVECVVFIMKKKGRSTGVRSWKEKKKERRKLWRESRSEEERK